MAIPQWCEDWLQFVLASFERDITLIAAADRVCFVLAVLFHVVGQRPGREDLRNIWKVLRLALFFQHPGAAAVAPVLLPLLWPYFTATLDHDTRNSYATLRAFPNRQRLYDAFRTCFMLLPQLDPAKHLHVCIATPGRSNARCGRYIGCSGESCSYVLKIYWLLWLQCIIRWPGFESFQGRSSFGFQLETKQTQTLASLCIPLRCIPSGTLSNTRHD